MEEDAVTILISLFNIAKGNRISINEDFRPHITSVTCNDAPGSLPESLLKQATTLPYGEDEKNVKVWRKSTHPSEVFRSKEQNNADGMDAPWVGKEASEESEKTAGRWYYRKKIIFFVK